MLKNIYLYKGIRFVFLMGLFCIPIFFSCVLNSSLPEHLYLTVGEASEFNLQIPVVGTVKEEVQVFSSVGQSAPVLTEAVDFSKNVSLKATHTGTTTLSCKIFGFLNWKNIEVTAIERQQVFPSGEPIGIYMETDGVLVIGTNEIRGSDGIDVNPSKNCVRSGDYIRTLNGEKVDSKETLIALIEQYGADPITLEVERDDNVFPVEIKPVETMSGEYKIGVWVKDDLAGIGTITYYEQDGSFGALGHSITDIDTGLTVSFDEGNLYPVNLTSIKRGEIGTPGQLYGEVLCYKGSIGTLSGNSDRGIFGVLNDIDVADSGCEAVDVGRKQDVEEGKAYLYSALSGNLCCYEIEITNLDYSSGDENKGICFEVTDQRLLELTGGVVQGMSGSPIIQNGKFVGAVTHVFVNDPSKGYGIFAETMMEK